MKQKIIIYIIFCFFVDNKYYKYLMNDPRIINLALNDIHQKLMETYIVLESLKFSKANNLPATNLEQFLKVINDSQIKFYTYSVLQTGLSNFSQTGDVNHLISISLQFNNPMHRNSKRVLI